MIGWPPGGSRTRGGLERMMRYDLIVLGLGNAARTSPNRPMFLIIGFIEWWQLCGE